MKHLKSAALIVALPVLLTLAGCASHKYVDEKFTATNTRIDEVDATTQEALNRATAAGKLAEGKFVYSVVLSDDSIRFNTGEAVLSDEARTTLTDLATRLKADNKNVYLEIQGFTDSTGTETHNHELSLRRGTTVETFFLRQGVDPERIEVRGLGEDQPVASNGTVAGRQQNRRVEIVMLSGGEKTVRTQQRGIEVRR